MRSLSHQLLAWEATTASLSNCFQSSLRSQISTYLRVLLNTNKLIMGLPSLSPSAEAGNWIPPALLERERWGMLARGESESASAPGRVVHRFVPERQAMQKQQNGGRQTTLGESRFLVLSLIRNSFTKHFMNAMSRGGVTLLVFRFSWFYIQYKRVKSLISWNM